MSESRWIPVGERLPAVEDECVLALDVVNPEEPHAVAWLNRLGEWCSDRDGHPQPVTHWMPLPSPPGDEPPDAQSKELMDAWRAAQRAYGVAPPGDEPESPPIDFMPEKGRELHYAVDRMGDILFVLNGPDHRGSVPTGLRDKLADIRLEFATAAIKSERITESSALPGDEPDIVVTSRSMAADIYGPDGVIARLDAIEAKEETGDGD